MRNRLNLLLLAGTLVGLPAGCTSLGVDVPKEVKVEVAVPCVEPAKRPRRPDLSRRADLLAMPEYERTLAAWADLRLREKYEAELEAVVAGCSAIP